MPNGMQISVKELAGFVKSYLKTSLSEAIELMFSHYGHFFYGSGPLGDTKILTDEWFCPKSWSWAIF